MSVMVESAFVAISHPSNTRRNIECSGQDGVTRPFCVFLQSWLTSTGEDSKTRRTGQRMTMSLAGEELVDVDVTNQRMTDDSDYRILTPFSFGLVGYRSLLGSVSKRAIF